MRVKNKQKSPAKLVGAYFVFVGVVLFCIGISGLVKGVALKYYEKSQSSEYVIGTVVSYQTAKNSSGGTSRNRNSSSTSYFPVYEYVYERETYYYTSSLGGSDIKNKHPEGSITTLILFGGDPSTVREDGFFWELRFYYGGVLFLLAAIVFAVVGGLISFGLSSLSRDYESDSPFQKQRELTLLDKMRSSQDQYFLMAGGLFSAIGVIFLATGFFLGDDPLFGSAFFALGMIASLVGGKLLYTFFSLLK